MKYVGKDDKTVLISTILSPYDKKEAVDDSLLSTLSINAEISGSWFFGTHWQSQVSKRHGSQLAIKDSCHGSSFFICQINWDNRRFMIINLKTGESSILLMNFLDFF
jgi:hypothetical protein